MRRARVRCLPGCSSLSPSDMVCTPLRPLLLARLTILFCHPQDLLPLPEMSHPLPVEETSILPRLAVHHLDRSRWFPRGSIYFECALEIGVKFACYWHQAVSNRM